MDVLCDELDFLWKNEYDKDNTVCRAKYLANQIALQKPTCDLVTQVLERHNMCMRLHNLVMKDWWLSENFMALHFAMDDVALAYNPYTATPVRIWTYVNNLLKEYKGDESNMYW